MDFYPTIANLEKELARIKSDMLYATKVFNDRFPPTTRTGAVLFARKCAQKKQCPRCPHSLVWNRYSYKQITTREGVKTWIKRWLPRPTKKIPRGIHLPDSGRPFREFQPVVHSLNEHNRILTLQIMRLNAFGREAEKRRKAGDPFAYGGADLRIIETLTNYMTECKRLLPMDEVEKCIRDFADKHPLHVERRKDFQN